jgi:hypothetical protein
MINFRRTGGSGDSDIKMDLDLGSMPGPVSQRLDGLLTESNFFDIPLVTNLQPEPGDHEYAITVVAGNSLHTVHATDSSMPKTLRPLIDKLTELAAATT